MDTELITRAKELYYIRMNLDQNTYSYMWIQCSIDYRAAWIKIAELEMDDELEIAKQIRSN